MKNQWLWAHWCQIAFLPLYFGHVDGAAIVAILVTRALVKLCGNAWLNVVWNSARRGVSSFIWLIAAAYQMRSSCHPLAGPDRQVALRVAVAICRSPR